MEHYLYILSIMKTKQCYNETNQKNLFPYMVNSYHVNLWFEGFQMLGKESKRESREGRLEIS